MDKKKKTQKETIGKVLRYVRPYRAFLFLSIVAAAATVGLTLYLPVLTGEAVDHVLAKGLVEFGPLAGILKKMAVVILLTALTQWIMNISNNKIAYHTVQDVRNQAFEKIQKLKISYIDEHSYGDVVSRIIADADQLSDGLIMGFTQLFTGVITILGTLLFMFTRDMGITLVVVLITPLSFLVAGFIAKRTFSMFKAQSEARGEQTAFIEEMISGQKVVQAFGREEKAMEEFDRMNQKLSETSLKAVFFSSLTNPCTRFVNSLVYPGVGLIGALSVIEGRITVGQLSCFLTYANQYTKPFNEISGVITELQNALACAARIFALIEEDAEVMDGTEVLEEPDGRVDLEGVSFSYDPEVPLIRDFNLHVKPGQRIAIVGPTGCGKTTLINLLMRFYETEEGRIRVSGKEIRSLTGKSLRSAYGMVLQDTWLKTGTIRENITMGRPDATREEILAASRASHAHSFIKRLPEGYDTMIRENGEGLSQGQKQLLCITRVMLCLPPMLILDEATSSIDTRTEMHIQEAFSKMMQGRTCFIVAHRLSTIREADVILYMEDGNIVEQGSHKTLLEKNGAYAKLYNSQFLAES